MGRLSDYINSGKGTERNGDVVVSGFTENLEAFGRIMTSDPDMARITRSYIRKLLSQARANLSKDAKSYMESDPRAAYRAVKHTVYKQLFGGNLSILQKRKSGAKYELKRIREVEQNPHMRGGNRRPYNESNSRLDKYFGYDRGFILRFISSGTVARQTRYGNRGSIRQSDWFGHTAPWHMETAAQELADAINEYVKQQTNGKK